MSSLPTVFLYLLSKVVELHLVELWGYKVEEASPDCASSPPLTHRSGSPTFAPPGLYPHQSQVNEGVTCSCRFADVLQTQGRSVAFIGKRADIALSLSNQVWQNSDKAVSLQVLRVRFHSFNCCTVLLKDL